MKIVNIKQDINLIVLIMTISMNTVLAAANSAPSKDVGDVIIEIENRLQPLSSAEVRQNKAAELRKYYQQKRLDKEERIRSRNKAKQEILGWSMQAAVNDICEKYRSHPKTYAKTYNAIATMNKSIVTAMNTIVENCDDKILDTDLDIELVQSVLLELLDMAAIQPDADHFILRGLEICNQRVNNKEYANRYDEVLAFHRAGNANISNGMEGVIRACSDLSSARFYEYQVVSTAKHLESYEKDKQAKIDRVDNKANAISRRAADRMKAQDEDRELYAGYSTIDEKIKACENFVQSNIDKVSAAIDSEKQENTASKVLTINYEGSRLIASKLHKILAQRKESCATRFDFNRKRKDLINDHQRPASHQNKTIDEILVLITQEKTQRKLTESKQRRDRKDAAVTGDMYQAADDICAKYKADPNVYARAYNAIAEMDILAVLPMDYVIDYCEGKILPSKLNTSSVKRVMHELNKFSTVERNTDLYVLRGLDICERYKYDADYTKRYDEVIAFHEHYDLSVMKSMIENTCPNISINPIKKTFVKRIESLIFNYENNKKIKKNLH